VATGAATCATTGTAVATTAAIPALRPAIRKLLFFELSGTGMSPDRLLDASGLFGAGD
jgi:hypothetical protein